MFVYIISKVFLKHSINFQIIFGKEFKNPSVLIFFFLNRDIIGNILLYINRLTHKYLCCYKCKYLYHKDVFWLWVFFFFLPSNVLNEVKRKTMHKIIYFKFWNLVPAVWTEQCAVLGCTTCKGRT